MPKAADQWAAFRSRKSDRPRAVRQFTDRTNFRQAYYRMVNRAFQEDFARAYVVSYYGKGGAGKSALLRRLEEELVKDVPPAHDVAEQDCLEARDRLGKGKKRTAVLRADFDDPALSSPADVLMRFRAQVLDQFKSAAFPLFDLAMVRLSQKYGRQLPPDKERALLSDNPVVSFALDVVGDLTGAGLVIKGAQTVTQMAQGLWTTLNGLKGIIRRCNLEISGMDAPELERRLPFYFAMDLNSMEPALVLVYLDTYEKMYARGEGVGLAAGFREDWLTGPWGLVPNLGSAVFAVGGRNRLEWPEQLAQPDGGKVELCLDDHVVEGLDEEDSIRFLQSCAIEDRALCAELHRISQGQPLYLDLCVDQYEALSPEKRANATAELFGSTPEALVERHIRYISEELRDSLSLLAAMGRWSDSLCARLSRTFPLLDPDSSGYGQLTRLSYVQREGDHWSMDRTVASILSAQRTSGLRQRLVGVLQDMAERTTRSLSHRTAEEDPLDLVWQAVRKALPAASGEEASEEERRTAFRGEMKRAMDALAEERSRLPASGQQPADALDTLREMARRALEQKQLFFPEELEETARQMEARARALYQDGAGDLLQALSWQEEAVGLWQSLGASSAHSLLESQAALAELRLEYLYVTGGLLTRDKSGARRFEAQDVAEGAALNQQIQEEWRSLIAFYEAILQRFPGEPAEEDRLPLARLWEQKAKAEQALEVDASESWRAVGRLTAGREEKLWYNALLHQGWEKLRIWLNPVKRERQQGEEPFPAWWKRMEEEKQQAWEAGHALLKQAWEGLCPLAERDRRFLPKALLTAELLCQGFDRNGLGPSTEAEEAELKTVEGWLRAQDSYLTGEEDLETLRDWRDWLQAACGGTIFLYSAPESFEGASSLRILWAVERLQEQINGLERVLGCRHPETLQARRLQAGIQFFDAEDPYEEHAHIMKERGEPLESRPVSLGCGSAEAEERLSNCKKLAELHQRAMGKWYAGTCEAVDLLAAAYELALRPGEAVPLRRMLWHYWDRLGEQRAGRNQQSGLINDLKWTGQWEEAIDLQKRRQRPNEQKEFIDPEWSILVHLYLARLWQEKEPSHKKETLDALLELSREGDLTKKVMRSAIQWCEEQGGDDPGLLMRKERLCWLLEKQVEKEREMEEKEPGSTVYYLYFRDDC